MTNPGKTKVVDLTKLERDTFYILLIAVVLLLGSYLFLTQRSVWNIFGRQQAESRIGALETKVASLEAEYMEIAGKEVNTDYARSLGFKDVTNEQDFAVKTAKTVTLSLASNEI
ncbi:MAG: hypothetical protein NTY66_04495 [Candidatus Vogelbacteria bacterium]|nr:hypothetical protein [Candidatus Vogelbacteria bacterium]